jgi:hypothetical protein
MMHVGSTGGGDIRETHIRAALAIPGLAVAAVYGRNANKLARLVQRYGIPHVDVDEFLAHVSMDLIIISSPSGVHADEAIAASRSGLHVLTHRLGGDSTARTRVHYQSRFSQELFGISARRSQRSECKCEFTRRERGSRDTREFSKIYLRASRLDAHRCVMANKDDAVSR